VSERGGIVALKRGLTAELVAGEVIIHQPLQGLREYLRTTDAQAAAARSGDPRLSGAAGA
jgi:hypothetical protein